MLEPKLGKGGCLCALRGGHATAAKDLYIQGHDQVSKDIKDKGTRFLIVKEGIIGMGRQKTWRDPVMI